MAREGDPVGALTIPANLAAASEKERRRAWLETLPTTIAGLAQRWELRVAEPFQPGGATAWVAPATNAHGDDVVLKLAWPHVEARHEADGLRLWSGQGMVRLFRAEDLGHTIALLVERCQPGAALSIRPEPDQDEVVARLLRRLWVAPPGGHPFPSLQEMCASWADGFDRKTAARRSPLEPGLVRLGIELFRALPATAEQTVVLCTDLHAGNVLAAERQPWLAIDPKPHVGDPTYDLLQHILNCADRLHADPLGLCDRMADLAGLDRARARLWLFARCVQESPDWPGLAEVAGRLAPP
jgi:streptomycin 6-kinase